MSANFYQDYRITRVEYPDYIDEIGTLRVNVWKNKEGMNPDLMAKGVWIDNTDKEAIHWVILKDEKIVGAARITIHEKFGDIPYKDMISKYSLKDLVYPVSSINRLVVHADYWNLGLAQKIDEIRIQTSRNMGIKNIIAEAVSWRIKSLEKLGFKTIGPIGCPIEAPGIMLTLMIKKL